MRFSSQTASVFLRRQPTQSKPFQSLYLRRRTLSNGIISPEPVFIPRRDYQVDVAGRFVAPRYSRAYTTWTSALMKPFVADISEQCRSMVTVTQTSAAEKIEPTQDVPLSVGDATTESTPGSSEHDLIITASCASRIKQLAWSRPNPKLVYLRLYVDAGGCSGFQYKFFLLSEDDSVLSDDEEEDGTIDPEEDIVYTIDGARLVIDKTSLELLRGSTIDYVQEMIRSSFAVVNNPQSESACGCGSSFAVKKFEANPALD